MKKPLLWSMVVVFCLSSVGAFAWRSWSHDGAEDKTEASSSPSLPEGTLELPPEKLANADVRCVPVTRQTVHPLRTVAGRVEYNGVRKVELRAVVDVVVDKVLVKPGDAVKAGTRLASFDSPEVGLLRAEVEKSQAELQIAEQSFAFADEIATNLETLLKVLAEHPTPELVEETFGTKLLGDHRQTIVAAYSRYQLAERRWRETQTSSISFPAQQVRQWATERQTSKENYQSASEQAQFSARQQRDKARANRDFAARMVDVSRQKLQTLLGAFYQVPEGDDDSQNDANASMRFYLIAPIGGTIEQRSIAPAQRLTAGTPAFTLADTATLWIAADIRERDWQALSIHEGAVITARIPALDDREFEVRAEFVGRAVDKETHAVPLVAVVDNAERLLRPGMFAWVSLPAGATEEALVVPPGAIMTHESKPFVFVEEAPRTFKRVDVTVGQRTAEGVTIHSGLTVGQKVVTRGAFLLKSELLLERGEEE